MAKYQLDCGVRVKALRICIYGVAGIGKTTLAAQCPNPVFIDVEDGSNQLPVARLPRPTSWDMLLDEVRETIAGNVPCSTLVIDTVDAAEELCIRHICGKHNWDGLESPGYGKGYTYLAEEFGKFLDLCGRVVDGGRNIVLVSHSMQRKVERPDEEGAYDRYELKLSKKVAPMVKEWSDMLLFCDYKTIVETESSKSGKVTKAKAKGGRRIIHTTFHVCWDAKNRFGLADELPLDYGAIAHCIPDMLGGGLDANMQPAQPMQPTTPAPQPLPQPAQIMQPPQTNIDDTLARMDAELQNAGFTAQPMEQPAIAPDPRDSYPPHAQALADLMRANSVTDDDLRKAVTSQGYPNCPVEQYPQDFVSFLTANFTEQILPVIDSQRIPF
jgi:hypothetical protein